LQELPHHQTPPLSPYTTLFRSEWPVPRPATARRQCVARSLHCPPPPPLEDAHSRRSQPERLPEQDASALPLPAHLQVVSPAGTRSEEHTSELQSPDHLVCRLLP